MSTVTLRAVGGSLMVAIPKQVLDMTGLAAGTALDLELDAQQRIVLTPKRRARYSLEELVAQCDPEVPLSAQEQAWLDDGPVGIESI